MPPQQFQDGFIRCDFFDVYIWPLEYGAARRVQSKWAESNGQLAFRNIHANELETRSATTTTLASYNNNDL